MQIVLEPIALQNQRAIELANNQSRSTEPVRAIELANSERRSRSRTSRAIAARLWDNAMAKAASQLF